MSPPLPPIARLAQRVLRDIELAVIRFPRLHKYQVGADLRRQAMQIARCVQRAWRDRSQQLQRVRELVLAVDDLKITMQLGQDVRAFSSIGQFEALFRLVADLGRQSGGWLKALMSNGQNGSASAPAQSAHTLSSRVAHGATP